MAERAFKGLFTVNRYLFPLPGTLHAQAVFSRTPVLFRRRKADVVPLLQFLAG